MRKKVVTFGEIMLRLSPPDYKRIIQSEQFNAVYGGGEANVATSLAHFGLESYFVTKVPDNLLGQSAICHLRRYGVKTDYIINGGDRLGIYFLEPGASQKPSQVIYDRSNSSVAEANPGEYAWDVIFNKADWFHITGITPAISEKAAQAALEACISARKAGATISCDINYRKKLWPKERAFSIMSEIMSYVDYAVGNEEDAGDVFGIRASDNDIIKGLLNEEGYKDVARQLKEMFDLKGVAITLRESRSASDNGWSGLLYTEDQFFFSPRYDIHIVDRVGGGDAFASGLIYGILQSWFPQDTIDFAVAASCLKHSIPGDMNMFSPEEVLKLAGGDASGRIQR